VKRAAPYLLFAGVTLAVFWKFLLFGHTMYAMSALESQLGIAPQEPRGWFRSDNRHARISDNLVVLAGQLRIYNEGLKANELRLWNPYLFCGLPTYADPMIHPFYPPNLLLHRLLSPDVAYEMGLLLHLFFSGVAMYALLRGLGRSPVAASLGGCVWMLGGYNAMWFSTGILSGLLVFGPLALLAIHRGLETRDRSRAFLGAAAMGMAILGSHPQHALLFFLFILGWIGVVALRSPELRTFSLRFGAIFLILSVGTGLVEILTRLDTIENGYRDPEFDALSLYSEPWRLVTYAGGLLLGKVYFPAPGWEAELAVYGGLAAVGLAVVGAVRSWSEIHVRYVAIAGVAAIVIAFVYPISWLFMKIPLLNLSPPSRCIFIAGFSLSLLSAQGLDALASSLGRAPRGAAWVAVAFVLAAIIGFEPVKISNGAALETALGFALVGAAAYAAYRWRRAALALGFAALLFELLPPFLQYNAHSDSSLLARTPEPVEIMKRTKEPWRGTGILGTTATSNKTEQWGNDLVTGNNLLALYGVENIGGFEAIIPRHYVTFAGAVGAKISPAGRTLQFTRFESPLLDFTGLRFVLFPSAHPVPARFWKRSVSERSSLYENPAAFPRARLVSALRIAKDDREAEQLLREPGFDPRKETILESDHPFASFAEGEIAWKERTPDRSSLEVNPKAAAILVVADTDYPGWEATIDGKPVPIYRANVAFRAVEVPAGPHRVEFRFRPSSARHGLIASTFFLLLSLGAAFIRRKP